jgi:hypothetical protein
MLDCTAKTRAAEEGTEGLASMETTQARSQPQLVATRPLDEGQGVLWSASIQEAQMSVWRYKQD